jgi:glycosyltransferase involved in cell wall biosynthesis
MMLKIAIDAHMVGQKETGNETYVLGLLKGLAQIDQTNRYFVLVTDPQALHSRVDLPDNFAVVPLKPSADFVRVPLIMPWVTHRLGADVLHVTYVAPPVSSCAQVVTIHDISFELFPHFFSARDRLMLSTMVPISIRLASQIIVESACTKADIVTHYKVAPEKLVVTPLAPDERFSPVRSAKHLQEVRQTYNLPEKFILTVGNLQPRKNLMTLLLAAAELKSRRALHGKLAIVGQAHWQAQAILDQVGQTCLKADDVRFLGYVPDQDLPALYSAAYAFAFPSLYEGFGLPPLEAMACGTPVICSNAGSLKEVVKDAGILLPPKDVGGWADALQSVREDAALRDDLIQRGLAHASTFSWAKTARKTLEVYKHVVEPKKPTLTPTH